MPTRGSAVPPGRITIRSERARWAPTRRPVPSSTRRPGSTGSMGCRSPTRRSCPRFPRRTPISRQSWWPSTWPHCARPSAVRRGRRPGGPDMRTTALRRQLKGRVVERHEAGYEQARQIWNGAIDKRPAVIAYCLDTADVVAALRFGREHDLPIAVRAGGHGVAGKCLPADGLVIDVRGLTDLAIDPATQIARAGAGLLNGEFDAATG